MSPKPDETNPTDAPAEPAEGSPPPTPPPAALDDASLTELIEGKVKALFAAQPKPAAPAAPAAEPVDVEAMVTDAIKRALAERDKEDQVFVLQQQLDELKASLPSPPRGGWGRYLLGPGLHR
jgi:hypothetical protein